MSHVNVLNEVSDLLKTSAETVKQRLVSSLVEREIVSRVDLLDKGLKEKVTDKGKDTDIYVKRIEEEMEVISAGGFESYFLILWDIIRWSEDNDIMVGSGRGSVGGSICAFLLGITKVDAIEYGLLFSRFLNSGRVGKKVQEEMIIFDTENGEKQYLLEDIVQVKRNGNLLNIKAEELIEEDEVINI